MNFMDKMSASLEKVLLPVAQKIGSQKHICALRDGFIATLTASMAGAMAVMINCVFLLSDSLIGEKLNSIGFWKDSVQPILDKWIINIGWAVQGGTLKIMAILIVFTIAYSLARSYEENPLLAALMAFCAYFVIAPQNVAGLFKLDKGAYVDGGGGLISMNMFGATSMFATILTAFIATEIYVRISKKGWVIKMPEQVPPAVANSFAAIIPGSITLVIFGIISVLFSTGLESNVPDWIAKTIQAPLMELGQSPFTMILLVFIAQFLWFFGLHGMNIVDGALQPLYSPPLLENIDLYTKGLEPKYALTRNFIDVYAMPGGSGGTMALLIAIFLFSKRQESKELAKLALAPGLFQINEPVIFGLPLVLNVTYFIPFIFISPLMLAIAYFFTAVVPFASYITGNGAWTTPPIISAFVATNGDIKACILAAGLLVLAVVLWAPFVMMANKMGSGEEA